MSVNRREEILSRLFEIVSSFTGFETVVRNRKLLENDKLPAIVLLDGDESIRSQSAGRGRVAMSTAITVLHPEVYVLLKANPPWNEGVGPELNTHRGAIIRAIAADAQLKALLGPNGDLTYDGAETDLKNGMAMNGQILLRFSLAAPMNPNQ